MKRTYLLLGLLLSGAGAFAQQYAVTARIDRPVLAGSVGIEQAIDRLTATNTVETNATARYTAGQSVILQPGFVAKAGSLFEATISNVVGHPSSEFGTTLTLRAFPNPFETTTTIDYNLPENMPVSHTLTDAAGKPIQPSAGREVELPGNHRTLLDLSRMPVGIYLYQVDAGNSRKVLRLIKK